MANNEPMAMAPASKASWYAIRKQDDEEEAEIAIYDMIGGWGVTADQFIRDIKNVKAKLVNVYINSPGGSVFDGVTISNAIKRMKAKVVTHVDGVAASIASVIAIAGHEVRMAKNSFMMIHNPMMVGGLTADAGELRKMADTLDKMRSTVANTYAEKTKKTPEEMAKLMDDETWFTADEALAIGLVDTITGEVKAAAAVDLSSFKNVPEPAIQAWGNQTKQEPKPEASQRSEAPTAAPTQEITAMPTDSQTANTAPEPAAVTPGVNINAGTTAAPPLPPLREQEIRGYVEQGRAAGRAEGEKAAVERFKAIMAVCPGKPQMAATAFIGGQNPDAVKMAFDAAAAAEAAAEARIAQIQEENARQVALAAAGGYSGGIGMSYANTEDQPAGPMSKQDAAEAAGKEWDHNPKVRNGFSSKDNYVAYRAAELRGSFRGKAVATS